MRMFERRPPKMKPLTPEVLATKIDEAVTAIRAEAERRDLGRNTIFISVERLREILRQSLMT